MISLLGSLSKDNMHLRDVSIIIFAIWTIKHKVPLVQFPKKLEVTHTISRMHSLLSFTHSLAFWMVCLHAFKLLYQSIFSLVYLFPCYPRHLLYNFFYTNLPLSILSIYPKCLMKTVFSEWRWGWIEKTATYGTGNY